MEVEFWNGFAGCFRSLLVVTKALIVSVAVWLIAPPEANTTDEGAMLQVNVAEDGEQE